MRTIRRIALVSGRLCDGEPRRGRLAMIGYGPGPASPSASASLSPWWRCTSPSSARGSGMGFRRRRGPAPDAGRRLAPARRSLDDSRDHDRRKSPGTFAWLLQIGYGRGGWYSYDWIDNDGKRSIDRIESSVKSLAVGDRIPDAPRLRTGGSGRSKRTITSLAVATPIRGASSSCRHRKGEADS